jgi:hypothetical protein
MQPTGTKRRVRPKVIKLDPEAIYTTEGASEAIGISRSTLDTLRVRGGGPVYSKGSRLIVYRGQALIDWLTGQTFQNTGQDTRPRPHGRGRAS